MRKKLIHKFIISTIIVTIACFIYNCFFYRISAEDQENSNYENQEIQTSAIIESQSKSMRNIRFYRRS